MDRKLKLGAGALAVGVVVAVAALGGVSSSSSGAKDPADAPKKMMTAKAGERYVNALKNKPAEGMSAKTTKGCGALPARYPTAPTELKEVVHASPQFEPSSSGDLAAESDLVVVAQVVGLSTRMNPDAKLEELKGLPPKERASVLRGLREQVAIMRVCEVKKGSVGNTIRVSRVGDASIQIETDGPYRIGERYMLYLVPRDVAEIKVKTYRPVSAVGRLFLKSDGSVDNSGEHSPVGQMLDGLPGVDAVTAVVASDVPPPPTPEPPTVTKEEIAKAQAAIKAGRADQVMGDVLEEVGSDEH